MITAEVIKEIYKKYDKRAASVDSLNIALLFEKAGILHDLIIDPETEELYIGTIPDDSPFHIVKLANVHAIIPFEEWVAIVMHSSIIFLNTRSPKTYIHLNTADNRSLWQKIFGK